MKQLEVEISRANNNQQYFQKLSRECFRLTHVKLNNAWPSSLARTQVYLMLRQNVYRTLLGAIRLQSAKPK